MIGEVILFKITFHPGDAAIPIGNDSDYPSESEILIGTFPGFNVEGFEFIEIARRDGCG
jgi:hypothetical protein